MKLSPFVVPATLGLMGLSLTSTAAHADAINVDFNKGNANPPSATYNKVGAAPDTGTVWNAFNNTASGQTVSNLLNSTGVTTGVSVTATRSAIFDRPDGLQATNNNASDLLRDFIAADAAGSTVTLNGLTSGTRYNLFLYGVGDGNSTPTIKKFGTAFTVGGVTKNTSGPNANTTNLTLGEDYVMFSDVLPTNNTITINYGTPAGGTGTNGIFNGLQL